MGKYEEILDKEVKEISKTAINWCKETDGAFSVIRFDKSNGFRYEGVSNIAKNIIMALGILEAVYDSLNEGKKTSDADVDAFAADVDAFAAVIAVMFKGYMEKCGGSMEGIVMNLGKWGKK